MESFVIINGKKFRKGYTTGSCAAGAAKAAVLMLRDNLLVDSVEIDTPSGVRLNLDITGAEFGRHEGEASRQVNDNLEKCKSDNGCESDYAKCGVVKDGGDDPDVTNGLVIYAKASFNDTGDIRVTGGEGIGKVTLPGLKVTVGEYAINPVPMRMIIHEVSKVKPIEKGVDIAISVPGGDEVAKKTYNPKLGIIGGISILGTTGIVNPMSEDAWKHSLSLEIEMAVAAGRKTLVFAFGNIGEDFVINSLGIEEKNVIIISNFVGFMLQKAMDNNIEKILMAGHIGKLIKVAGGIFNTHSRIADARMEILTAYSGLEGANKETLNNIYNCKTTDEAVRVIQENELNSVFERVVGEVSRRCKEYTFGKIDFGTILFYWDNKILSCDNVGENFIKELGGKLK